MKNTLAVTALTAVLALGAVVPVASAQSFGYGGGGGGFSNRATRAVRATRDVRPATPAVPARGRVLGAEGFRFLVDLKQGMSNNDVMELQKRLRAEGFFTYPTDTGYFGTFTFNAVVAYQLAHPTIGFVTGFVGPLTRAELNK